MTTTDTFTLARTAFAEAAEAFRDRDYTTAIDRLLEAQSYLSAVPDSSSNRGSRVEFGREISTLLAAARERERSAATSSSGGPQVTKLRYKNLSDECE
jgi:hypothetical protein